MGRRVDALRRQLFGIHPAEVTFARRGFDLGGLADVKLSVAGAMAGGGLLVLNADDAQLQHGVYTASSGNSGLGLAWMARELGLAATVYAPESAPPEGEPQTGCSTSPNPRLARRRAAV